MNSSADAIDRLVGIAPGSALDAIRARRPEARRHAQASFLALFEPADPGGVSAVERHALACFVVGLHRQPAIAAFYRQRLQACQASAALIAAIDSEIALAAGRGPYGSYPAGPLSGENEAGPRYRIGSATRAALGPRLAAAFEHVHMLAYHPRDSAPAWLQSLLDAGWSTDEIVTLSQLVAFLSFQIRVVVGLRALAGLS